MLSLYDPIDTIPFIGPTYNKLLANIGIITILDILYHVPARYVDASAIVKLSDLNTTEKKTVQVTLIAIKSIRTRGGKLITEAKVTDESGEVDVIWFNQLFLTKTLKIGSTILLNGALNPNHNKPQLYSPSYEIVKDESPTHLGIIVPVYSVTEGVTDKWLRSRIKYLLQNHRYLFDAVTDSIPRKIRDCYDLIPLQDALIQIHFPKDWKGLQKARRRIAFDELLNIQLKLLKSREAYRNQKTPMISDYSEDIKSFLEKLPFNPTRAQKRVIRETLKDLTLSYPANRLIQGDVGCGKTLVAAAVSIPVIKSGYQVALMAPTSILAKQHYETINELLGGSGITIKLVTGSINNTNHKTIKQSEFIIGTHALLHRYDKLFNKLGLIIIDEQHRFGVKQRKKLTIDTKKSHLGTVPHKITMTATPIPRSIALTLFGDLDISIIDEMPTGRIPTKTYLVPKNKRKNSYQWIEERIQKKSQVFWLCPLIEESEKLQIKAVLTEYQKLETEIFPDLKIDVLHGRLSEEEKNDKIHRMKKRKIDILVSTSVIEVGMDIPNADIIVIEGAERFGLAQLHQLRGRVGRKADQHSWCFLFTSNNASPEAQNRLEYFSKTNDGLKVAEYDLERRGPGEVYGIKQAGIPDLKVARITDIKLVKETREASKSMIQ